MSGPLKDEVVLSLRDEPNFFSKLSAGFDSKGDLVITGHDISDVVEEIKGRDEYEYWITFSKESIFGLGQALAEVTVETPPDGDRLAPFVTATLRKLFQRTDLPVHFTKSSDLRTWCASHGIESHFSCWP